MTENIINLKDINSNYSNDEQKTNYMNLKKGK